MSKPAAILVFNATIEAVEQHQDVKKNIENLIKSHPKAQLITVCNNKGNDAFKTQSDLSLEGECFDFSHAIQSHLESHSIPSKHLIVAGFDSMGKLYTTMLCLHDKGYQSVLMKQSFISTNGFEMTSNIIRNIQRNLGKKTVK